MMLRLKSYSELKSVFTKITEVHFYSPGCSSALSFDILEFSLKSYFVNAKVIIKSDCMQLLEQHTKVIPYLFQSLVQGQILLFTMERVLIS